MPKNLCCGCKNRFEKSGMIRLPGGMFHSFDCALEYAKRGIAKKAKSELAKEKAKKAKNIRIRKESLKPISKLKREAQSAYNKWIRARDVNEPCISCGKSRNEVESEQGWKVGGCWDAGHFMSRGAKPQLRFNAFNVHKQCKRCNGGSGKFSAKAATVGKNYEIRLALKIGGDRVELLKNNNEFKKYDAEYLKRIKAIFSKRYRVLIKRQILDLQ